MPSVSELTWCTTVGKPRALLEPPASALVSAAALKSWLDSRSRVGGSTSEDGGSRGDEGEADVASEAVAVAAAVTVAEDGATPSPPAAKPISRRLWERALFNQHISENGLPVKVGPSPHGGDGLYAARAFSKSEKIVQFHGTPCTRENMVDFRNSISLVPLAENTVFDDKELTVVEAAAVINTVPGLSAYRSNVTAGLGAELVLDPRGWINPAQKCNDAAYRKHIHKKTYVKEKLLKNNCDFWHRIVKAADGTIDIQVEVRSLKAIKPGEEICCGYGSGYWFERNGAKLTC